MIDGPTLCCAGLIGLLALDNVLWGPFLACRPLVVGPATGAVLGNAPLGLLAGACVELLWLRRPPAGLLALEPALVSAWGVAWALASPRPGVGSMLAGLLLAWPAAWVSGPLEGAFRRWNGGLWPWVKGHLEAGRHRGIAGALLFSGGMGFLKAGMLFLAGVWAGQWPMDFLYRHSPPAFLNALEEGGRLLPVVAFASAAGYFTLRLKETPSGPGEGA